MQEVYITGISKYLPYEPISNDEMEQILGFVDNKPSKVRSLILRNNGIKTRYYAFRETKKILTNAFLTAAAVRQLFINNPEIKEKVELLSCGTTSPDQTLPSHAAMVHGELNIKPIEIASFSGACNTGIQSLKFAFLSILSGEVNHAIATGSERMSRYMTADKFKAEIDKVNEIEDNGYIAFEKDFLRWMLSDGAGAILIQNKPAANKLSLKIEWIESTSFASELETCMYAGAVKDQNGNLVPYNDIPTQEWLTNSVFAVKQDTKLLAEHIVVKGMEFLKNVVAKRKLDTSHVDWFLPHLSSEFFRQKIKDLLEQNNMDIPYEKWFTNLSKVGNVGAASVYLMLEELYNTNQFSKGQKILIMVPESARFSYSYIYLTVV